MAPNLLLIFYSITNDRTVSEGSGSFIGFFTLVKIFLSNHAIIL